MIPPDEPAEGAPAWLLTYGDLMSLLLTFFVLLVSMSELKNENRVVQAVEAMNHQFGKDSQEAPDGHRLRGAKVDAPLGSEALVQGVRTGRQAMIGGSVLFDEESSQLSDDQIEKLKFIAEQFQGKAQKIEIRGHTTRRPLPSGAKFADHWDLAYARCRAAFDLLAAEGIDPARMRLSVAAGYEPTITGDDPLRRRENSRVEAFLLNEFVGDYENAAAEAAAAAR